MKQPNAPRLDVRRAKEFESELFARARAWIPSWGVDDNGGDFGRALLKVAARFSSEVAERLDRAGEKIGLGLLDWLAVEGEAARPARLPVVFKFADSIRNARLAKEATRLQVEAAGEPVILETEKDVYLLPSQLKLVIGVDADKDAFYLPPPDLSSLAPIEPLPTQWRLKSFASAGTVRLQLDPELGLVQGMLVEIGGRQYRLDKPDKGIVIIDPPLAEDQAERSSVIKVTAFAPFDGAAHNQQQHMLYLGDKELLNVEAAATFEIVGAKNLKDAVSWHYWGKRSPSDEVNWQELPLAAEDQQAKSDALVLSKSPGSIEPLEVVQGMESRWIRASVGSAPGQAPLLVDALEIRLNRLHGAAPPPSGDDAPVAAPAAEAMANTTPLVLDSTFFPFGKEPRQFDGFYLGSKEAFSKKGADVKLKFDLADTTFAALTAVRSGDFADKVIAGVAQDGALHLLEVDAQSGAIKRLYDRPALRPKPGTAGSTAVALNPRPRRRVPVWHDIADPKSFLVAAAARDEVWVWRENSRDPADHPWISFGTVPTEATTANTLITDVVSLAGTSLGTATLFALRGGRLFRREWPQILPDDTPWVPVATETSASNPVLLTSIIPVLTASTGVLATSAAEGMIGLSRNEISNLYDVYLVMPSGACSTLFSDNIDSAVPLVAVRYGGDVIVAYAQEALLKPVIFRSGKGTQEVPLSNPEDRTVGFDATLSAGSLYFLATVQSADGAYLASWQPHETPSDTIELFRADIPAGTGTPGGAPVQIAGRVVVPGTRGDLLSSTFNLAERRTLHGDVGEAIFTPGGTSVFQQSDLVARAISATQFSQRYIFEAGTTLDDHVFYVLDQPFASNASGAVHGFRLTGTSFTGSLADKTDTLDLDSADRSTIEGSLVRVGTDVFRVTKIDPNRVATVISSPTAPVPTAVYWSSVPINGRVAPFMRLSSPNSQWDAAILDQATLVFSGASPAQRGKAFSVTSGNNPLLIELSEDWLAAPNPTTNAQFVLDAAVGSWARSLGDTSTNPELSWEYWNGTGWWKLGVTRDETLHLKASGDVSFKVPLDLAPTDWSGRTNYWIRARLIGGDYGRESVSVATSPPDDDGVTHQTVERSTEDIHAPSVLKLSISYEIRDVRPTFVLTNDSGTLRDQSDANRTVGARVEAFVPLAVMLGRLSSSTIAPAADDDCPQECDCLPGAPTTAGSTPTPTTPPAGPATSASGRALYVGFDKPLSGAPVNVLMLVEEERQHDALAPMTIEALVADQFVPILVNDTTRALGESGILSLAFALKPTPRELFGQTLTWLRLTPRTGASEAGWKPTVRGAYLNAVWASAAETLTHELVGSSQGEPRLTLHLARPPVLENTLELRVREPLGQEEREELALEGEYRVLSAVKDLPGDWVLWRRVIDPDDERSTERVYTLDEATGEIRFGDGRHGRIPPIGRDSIVAFKYRRTETGTVGTMVPANTITARTPLNLVSPIDGVEAVFAADQAAGGAPAESTERVLRFGTASLRHRGRALTARDVEDLTLESFPDMAQARCFLRKGFVQLVVVMRGADPMPSAAQVREIGHLLRLASVPSLSATQALRVGGPAIRRLRVDLRLRVASLDDAGSVAYDAKHQIIALFDTSTGGPGKDGWPLGDNPKEGDIAVALAGVPRLESIAGVQLLEITEDGADRPWPETLRPTELAMPHPDVTRVEFETTR